MPLITFFVFIAVNWWASWYPGAEPGGGGYVASGSSPQKTKSTPFSRPSGLMWPIMRYARGRGFLVGLVAVSVTSMIRRFKQTLNRATSAFLSQTCRRTCADLMLAAFAAAYMSTIGTQLNWGASYLVNDVYRRFWNPNKNEKHYVSVSQGITMMLMILSAIVTFYMDSIGNAWRFLMAVGAGTGLVYILRWFWWRINAWSEISAMIAAFIVSMILQFGFHLNEGEPKEFAYFFLSR